MFALVDCNNFYVSCERVFRPDLENEPMVVLSNNDGCFISRSNEVKALGVPMGAPYFQYRQLLTQFGVKVFSTNFTLYGDMSSRVMTVLSGFSDKMEIYSVDEAFLDLGTEALGLEKIGRAIREMVMMWVGIPVSVGIAKTKTLAKLANEIAKTQEGFGGVCMIKEDDDYIDVLLDGVPVRDVWGVGRQYAKLLHEHKVFTALDLRNLKDDWVERQMTIVGLRTVWELRGKICYDLESSPVLKKTLATTRSFASSVRSYPVLRQSVARFASRAAEKLRSQHSCAGHMTLFVATNRHKDEPQYSNSISMRLPSPTADTGELVAASQRLLTEIFKDGFGYKRAGVILSDLVPEDAVQMNLYLGSGFVSDERRQLMLGMDELNRDHGHDTVGYGRAGLRDGVTTVQTMRSPRYTTRWDELARVSL